MDPCLSKDASCPKTKPAHFTPGGLIMMGQDARNTDRLSLHRIVNQGKGEARAKHAACSHGRHCTSYVFTTKRAGYSLVVLKQVTLTVLLVITQKQDSFGPAKKYVASERIFSARAIYAFAAKVVDHEARELLPGWKLMIGFARS